MGTEEKEHSQMGHGGSRPGGVQKFPVQQFRPIAPLPDPAGRKHPDGNRAQKKGLQHPQRVE